MKIKKRTFDFKSLAFQVTGTGHLETFRVGKNDGPVWKPDWHLSPTSAILSLERKADIMCKKFTPDELNQMDQLHIAKFSGQQGRILRPDRAKLTGQFYR